MQHTKITVLEMDPIPFKRPLSGSINRLFNMEPPSTLLMRCALIPLELGGNGEIDRPHFATALGYTCNSRLQGWNGVDTMVGSNLRNFSRLRNTTGAYRGVVIRSAAKITEDSTRSTSRPRGAALRRGPRRWRRSRSACSSDPNLVGRRRRVRPCTWRRSGIHPRPRSRILQARTL
jgi:hypothetical protein